MLQNFVGVFQENHMNKFIDFKLMISEITGKYPFLIANTDSSDKDGTHWWSITDIEPKPDLFFFSFGIYGLKNFVIQDDECIIQDKFFVIEKITRADSKITLVNIKFPMNVCKNLTKAEIDN